MNDNTTDNGHPTTVIWSYLEVTLGVVATILLLGLVAVTCIDVVGRYFLDAPLKGAFELTEVMLAALVFSALPLTTQRQEHVEVDLLAMTLSTWINEKLIVFAQLFSAALLVTFSWRLFVTASRVSHDGATTNALQIPLTPFAYLAAISCLISAMVSLLLIFQQLKSSKTAILTETADD